MANRDDRWRDEDERYGRWSEDERRRMQSGTGRYFGRDEEELRGEYGRYGGHRERGYRDRPFEGHRSRERGLERDLYGRGDDHRRGYGGTYRGGEYAREGGYGAAVPWEEERGGYGEPVGRSGYSDYYGGSYGVYPGTPGYRGGYGYGGAWEHDRDRWAGRGGEGERGFFERAGDEVASWFGDEEAERRRRMDARRSEEGARYHRGRGPKGYKRSDERIREDVSDRLTDDPWVDASEVEVAVSNGEVTLSGTVDSRQAKRRAEDVAEDVSGVTHVQNSLRVRQGATWPGGAPAGTGVTAGTTATTTGAAAVQGTAASRRRS